MKVARKLTGRALPCLAVAVCLTALSSVAHAQNNQQNPMSGMGGGQQQQRTDPRKLTTVQTASLDVGNRKGAVEVRYLNLPFGATTFGYMEKGGNRFYSNRTWPFAHLRLQTAATYEGKTLQPGDYVLIITPKSEQLKTSSMTLSLARFKPATAGGTYLVPGDVFTQVPRDAEVVVQKPITFGSGAPTSNSLRITLDKEGQTVAMKLHYGDRTLTERLNLR